MILNRTNCRRSHAMVAAAMILAAATPTAAQMSDMSGWQERAETVSQIVGNISVNGR